MKKGKEANAGMWRGKALVLGDTDFYRVLLSYLLESKGLRVTVARTADEAIERLARENYSFDFCILNLCLPGLDHIKVFRHFNDVGSKIHFPVYAIKRVFTTPVEDQELRSLGLSDFLDKSLMPEEIIFRLGQHFFEGGEERRNTVRIPVYLPTDYRVADQSFSGYVTDLGTDGLFLQVLEALPSWVDLVTELCFRLPGSSTVRTLKGKNRHAKAGHGLGIRFHEVPEDHQKAINDFVQSYMF